jgi:hypothetical protein
VAFSVGGDGGRRAFELLDGAVRTRLWLAVIGWLCNPIYSVTFSPAFCGSWFIHLLRAGMLLCTFVAATKAPIGSL